MVAAGISVAVAGRSIMMAGSHTWRAREADWWSSRVVLVP